MKVAKEQIVGMVAAVDWVLSQTEVSMQGDYQKRVDLIASAVKGIPSVRTETVVSKDRQPCSTSTHTFRPSRHRRQQRPRSSTPCAGNAFDRIEPEHWSKAQPRHPSGCEHARGWSLVLRPVKTRSWDGRIRLALTIKA
jgi:hypothetical protein